MKNIYYILYNEARDQYKCPILQIQQLKQVVWVSVQFCPQGNLTETESILVFHIPSCGNFKIFSATRILREINRADLRRS